ncbi:MAG: hypothetical protein FWG50_09460 [Kiritimatiellaeota bacterium]|nr:hypothetical protein [Kiritimatiellota bacterium]
MRDKILFAFLTALAALAAVAEVQSPFDMALCLEKSLSEFAGALSPDAGEPCACYQGVLPFPEADPAGFPQAFIEGLSAATAFGVTVWPANLRVDDASGVTFFYNAQSNAFWEVPPVGAYSADWIEQLHGNADTPLMQALLRPSHVVAQWLFIAEADIPAYHAARLAVLAPGGPAPLPPADPNAPHLRVTAFAPAADAHLFASAWNAAAYFPLARMDVWFTHDLLAPEWSWVRSVAVPPAGPVRTAFFDVPRAMLPPADPSLFAHDPGCTPVTNIVVSPLAPGVSYTNAVCDCARPAAPAGFFRLGIPDPSQNIPAWWRVLHGLAPYDSWEDFIDFTGDGNTNQQKHGLGLNPIAPPGGGVGAAILYRYDDDDRLTHTFAGPDGDAAVRNLTPAGNPAVQQERNAQ